MVEALSPFRTRSRKIGDEAGNEIASNHFASLVLVHVARAIVGTELEFKDAAEPPRVVVTSLGHADECGVALDDVVVAFGGRSVQRHTTAEDLGNVAKKQRAGTISMLLWGLHRHLACYGIERAVYCTTLDVDFGEIPPPRCMHFAGTVITVIDMNTARLQAARAIGIERADILIGINYEPLPDVEPQLAVSKRIRENLLLGPVTLNFWRCTDLSAHDELQMSAIRATRIARVRHRDNYKPEDPAAIGAGYDCANTCHTSTCLS